MNRMGSLTSLLILPLLPYAVGKSREDSHALCTDIDESAEQVVDVPVSRGDVVVHHERTLHCSYPNMSQDWRHAYILNSGRGSA